MSWHRVVLFILDDGIIFHDTIIDHTTLFYDIITQIKPLLVYFMCDVIWLSPRFFYHCIVCKYCYTIHPHVSNEPIECKSNPHKAKERRNCKKKTVDRISSSN